MNDHKDAGREGLNYSLIDSKDSWTQHSIKVRDGSTEPILKTQFPKGKTPARPEAH